MKEVTLSIPLVDGSVWYIHAYQIGSFAVHLGGHDNEDVWTITHIPTQSNIVNGLCFSKSRAFKIAKMLKRIFTDSELIFVEQCAQKIQEGVRLSPQDNLKYQALYGMMWADRSISRYAK